MRKVVERAELVSDRVHVADARLGEGEAGEAGRDGKALPGVDVVTVLESQGQIAEDRARRGHGEGARRRCGERREVRLDRMRDRVHTRGRGHVRRQADHEVWIKRDRRRHELVVDDGKFPSGLRIGDDGSDGHLRAAAGRRRHRKKRQDGARTLK